MVGIHVTPPKEDASSVPLFTFWRDSYPMRIEDNDRNWFVLP